MAKVRVAMGCRSCGHQLGQWAGRCPSCGAWGTVEERAAGPALTLVAEPLAAEGAEEGRLTTGLRGFDRVLGGGLVGSSVVLVAGEPGIGKSTLLLQAAAGLSAGAHRCLYASGEESGTQVAGRARRLGLADAALSFIPGRDLAVVLDAARTHRPALLIVDSIQSLRHADNPGLPGGTAQVRACADALVGLAKAEGVTVILAGQVTKDGDLAGPRALEHAVDVVCSFDGDPRTGLRILAGGKNRFGAEGEVAWFEMGPSGLVEVDPALSVARSPEPGAATAVLATGRRGLAVEIQALVVPTEGPPRRNVSGLDPRRFGMVAAVVDRVFELRLARAELYGASAGGLRVEEPGADLALAAALASAATGVAPPEGTAFVGEVALTGEVRPAANAAVRLSAAANAAVETVVLAGDATPPAGLRVRRVRHLREALGWCLPTPRSHGRGAGPNKGRDQRF